jgi:hypothetical protein
MVRPLRGGNGVGVMVGVWVGVGLGVDDGVWVGSGDGVRVGEETAVSVAAGAAVCGGVFKVFAASITGEGAAGEGAAVSTAVGAAQAANPVKTPITNRTVLVLFIRQNHLI